MKVNLLNCLIAALLNRSSIPLEDDSTNFVHEIGMELDFKHYS
jgi:hypothetical protein